MRGAISFFTQLLVCALLTDGSKAAGQPPPLLTWITNSSIKLEQIIGDVDWAAKAQGRELPTASQTITRFHIMGNGLGYSFEDHGKLIFLFGDTTSEDQTNLDGPLNYHAADPLAWSTNTDGEAPLLLNFFTNNPIRDVVPIFVQPAGIEMGAFDVPNAGISLSNGVFLVCNTGSDGNLSNAQSSDFSELVTFNESLAFSTNTMVTDIFATNRVVSTLNTNLDPKSALQGHFINVSMREFGTNVMMFGTGEYRSGDIFLCMTPTANFVTGIGTRYFAGLANNQPLWSNVESDCHPVVQDNPTNGPPWPNDSGTAGNVSVIHPTNLGLWMMTYDGGRSAETKSNKTTGIYFSCAPQPWGPWSTPQLIFNKSRDNGYGVFIYDPSTTNDLALAGPTINPAKNPPSTTPGGDFAPIMVERFTRITNSTLFIYYTMSTWNPYTVVKMRSAFTITPVIDPDSPVNLKNKFSFAWIAPTNIVYQVDYSTNLLSPWNTFTNLVTSTNGIFNFTDNGANGGGFGAAKYYRLKAPQ